jgi:hypothetical protein
MLQACGPAWCVRRTVRERVLWWEHGRLGRRYLGGPARGLCISAGNVATFVVSDSLDPEVKERAEEWETAVRAYLEKLSERAEEEAGVKIAFSTGVSLTEELNKSTNTDKNVSAFNV